MALLGAVREVEAWTAANVIRALVLLTVAVVVLVWAVRRYLRD